MRYHLDKPKRNHASLAAFRRWAGQNRQQYFDEHQDAWPCLTCRGAGKIRDPDYERDVIEGYKLAGRVRCQLCNGTGIGTSRAVRTAYTRELAQYRERLVEYKMLMGTRQAALAKLTDREITALDVFMTKEELADRRRHRA